jgi:hypothetical protein
MNAARILLLVGALLVVGLVLGLVFSLHGERASRPIAVAPSPNPNPTPPPNPNPPPTPNPTPTPTPTPRPTPAPPTMTPPAPEAAEPPIVRDHRGEGPPPGPRHGLLPDTMVAARNALTPEMQACGAGITQISDAGKARFFVHATYHVANGRITASDVQLDGADALGPEYADCVRRAFAALGAPAPAGQPDGDELVHLPFVGP